MNARVVKLFEINQIRKNLDKFFLSTLTQIEDDFNESDRFRLGSVFR
jgi:hypothetical protein